MNEDYKNEKMLDSKTAENAIGFEHDEQIIVLFSTSSDNNDTVRRDKTMALHAMTHAGLTVDQMIVEDKIRIGYEEGKYHLTFQNRNIATAFVMWKKHIEDKRQRLQRANRSQRVTVEADESVTLDWWEDQTEFSSVMTALY